MTTICACLSRWRTPRWHSDVKHNDPKCKSIYVRFVTDLGERIWARLGHILGKASHVEGLAIMRCPVNVVEMCVGFNLNRSINDLSLLKVDLGDDILSSVVPFLSRNTSQSLTLRRCNLGPVGVNLLSTTLLQLSEDTLIHLNLADNHIGIGDIDLPVPLQMMTLNLENSQIGSRGCASLAKLPGSMKCELMSLNLRDNSILATSLFITCDVKRSCGVLMLLADSLETNNDGITTEGWLAMLKLVCNTLSIKGYWAQITPFAM